MYVCVNTEECSAPNCTLSEQFRRQANSKCTHRPHENVHDLFHTRKLKDIKQLYNLMAVALLETKYFCAPSVYVNKLKLRHNLAFNRLFLYTTTLHMYSHYDRQ